MMIPYNKIIEEYEADPSSDHLRLGQWFINKHLRKSDDSVLFSLHNRKKIMERLLNEYYIPYQWPLE